MRKKTVVTMVICAILLPTGAWAQTVLTKANNNTALSLAGSWVENLGPDATRWMIWSNNVTTPEYCTNDMATGKFSFGIKIFNPAADVMITNKFINLGDGGIDMSQAEKDLSFANPIIHNSGVSSVIVPAGRRLTFFNNYVLRGVTNTWQGGGEMVILGSIWDVGDTRSGEYTISNINMTSEVIMRFARHTNVTAKVFQVGGNVSLLPKTGAFGLCLGHNHNVIASYDLSAGALTVSTNVALGSYDNALYTNMNSTLIVRGTGVATITNDIWMGGNKCLNGVATVTLGTGGTLSVGSILVNSLVNNYTSIVEFDGGTMKPMRDTTTFLDGLTQATLSTNGAVIDTAGFNVTIAQPFINAAGQAGRLVKLGTGTLNLTNAHTFTGPAVVSNGVLSVAAASLTSTNWTVAAGGTLAFSDSVNLAGKVLTIDVGTAPAGLVTVTGNLTLGGVLTVKDFSEKRKIAECTGTLSGEFATVAPAGVITYVVNDKELWVKKITGTMISIF